MTEVLFEMYRGDDKAFIVRVRDKLTDAPIDLTSWRFLTTMKRSPVVQDHISDENDETAPVKVNSGQLSGVDAVAGEYHLLLPHDQTKDLGPGLYYIDISRELSGSYITAVHGRVRVIADVTRRTI